MLLAKGQRNVIVYLYKVIILYCIRIMSLVIVFGLFFSQKRHSKAPQKKTFFVVPTTLKNTTTHDDDSRLFSLILSPVLLS